MYSNWNIYKRCVYNLKLLSVFLKKEKGKGRGRGKGRIKLSAKGQARHLFTLLFSTLDKDTRIISASVLADVRLIYDAPNSGLKLQESKLRLDIRGNFFMVRAVKH